MEVGLKRYDLDEIRKAIKLLFAEVKFGAGECIEVRVPDKKKHLTACGWFDDIDALARAVALLAKDGHTEGYKSVHENVYWTINPVDDALLARQPKNIICFAVDSTSDSNITRRMWLPADVDPLRPMGVSATNEERKLGLDVANALMQKLGELGFEETMIVGGTSGNGYHILIRVDLPNNEESKILLKNCIAAMQTMVGTGKVEIDPKMFNASRIIKAYGSMACKGMNDPKRPWRMSRLTIVPPGGCVAAPKELLEKLAVLAPTTNPKRAVEARTIGPWTVENVQEYLDKGTNWECHQREPRGNKAVAMWVGPCLVDVNHRDAALILHDDGWWSYGCFHAGCNAMDHNVFKDHWTKEKGSYNYPHNKKITNQEVLELLESFEAEAADENSEAPTTACPEFNNTDSGNMERLVWRHGKRLKHTKQRGWYMYDGKRWRPGAEKMVKALALDTSRHIEDEKWAHKSEGLKELNAMVTLAESFLPVLLDEFDTDKMLFNVQNGTLDLRTGELHPHDKNDMITNISPITYDPKAECPLWLSFLDDVTASNG